VRQPELARPRREVSMKEVRDAILIHLRHMCTTHMSSSLAAPDFGLPDIGESIHNFPGTISILAQCLTAVIRKYEPRLINVRVDHVPADEIELFIRYEISAQLANGDETPVSFETRIDTARRVSIT
jgi:type VI secretion system protein